MDGTSSIQDGQLALFMVGTEVVTRELSQIVAAGRAKEVVDLNLTGNNLKTLPDLSAFKRLTSLVLDGNELSGRLKFPALKALDTLSLNKNKLSNVDHVLKGVAGLSSLRYLSMMHNPCTPDCFAKGKDAEDYAKFRLHIIFKIKSLCCLDYQDISPAEREKASAVGAFAKTASPREMSAGAGGEAVSELTIDASVGEVEDDHVTTRGKDDSRAYLGYSPYKHLAHDSEGNRTIGSDDL